jgi:hypothetical protein
VGRKRTGFLAKLLRNKSAHLGSDQFREIGFHDDNRIFYTFLPTRWPLIWEEHIKIGGSIHEDDKEGMKKMRDALMRQDKISYLFGLRAKVTTLVDAGTALLVTH